MLYNILLIFSAVECFNPDLSYNERNYSKTDTRPLFEENVYWSQGDIPLLNKKIFKGTRVTIREHPYIASIRRNLVHYSVGAMLTKNLFITVAHPLIEVPSDELGIVVGENYADRGSTLLTVILVIFHEDFNQYTLNADIALIRVYEDTMYRCSVKSIQLVHPWAPLTNKRAFVTGWGRCDRTGRELCLPRSSKYTPDEKFDPMLRSVTFTLDVPNLYCEGYKRNGVHLLPGMLCVGRAREEDRVAPCLAVPGAPLVVDAHLAGLQSWGFGCGYENDLPLIYTDLQFYQPWLLHNIPIIRRVTHENLTILFEAKRAYVLSKWLKLTRIEAPEPMTIGDKPMEMLKLDKLLAKIRGHVYDIRDLLFNGFYHKYKMRIYNKLRIKYREKEILKEQIKTTPVVLKPFLNPNETADDKVVDHTESLEENNGPLFVDEIERDNSDSDQTYGDYD